MPESTLRRFAEVELGEPLPTQTRVATRVTMFLFGVAYFTPHRLHYDVEFARQQGFDDVLVTATLLSAYNAKLVSDWAGGPSALVDLEERNVTSACAGQTLIIGGQVTGCDPAAGGGGLVRCALTIDRASGDRIVTANATLRLP